MREAIKGHEKSLGLTSKPKQGRKSQWLNFVDEIARSSDQLQKKLKSYSEMYKKTKRRPRLFFWHAEDNYTYFL